MQQPLCEEPEDQESKADMPLALGSLQGEHSAIITDGATSVTIVPGKSDKVLALAGWEVWACSYPRCLLGLRFVGCPGADQAEVEGRGAAPCTGVSYPGVKPVEPAFLRGQAFYLAFLLHSW